MYNFILLQYRMGKIGEAEIRIFVDKGRITEAQAETILSEGVDDN